MARTAASSPSMAARSRFARTRFAFTGDTPGADAIAGRIRTAFAAV
jgi:hypothetical protein